MDADADNYVGGVTVYTGDTVAGALNPQNAGEIQTWYEYIGNAPNFMVRSIAETGGIKMPSFFGYMAWSAAILVPCFVLMNILFIN